VIKKRRDILFVPVKKTEKATKRRDIFYQTSDVRVLYYMHVDPNTLVVWRWHFLRNIIILIKSHKKKSWYPDLFAKIGTC
jgi:hypothetical protein